MKNTEAAQQWSFLNGSIPFDKTRKETKSIQSISKPHSMPYSTALILQKREKGQTNSNSTTATTTHQNIQHHRQPEE